MFISVSTISLFLFLFSPSETCNTLFYSSPPPLLYTTRSPMRAGEEMCAAEGCHNKALTKEGCESKLGIYLAPFARTACYIQYF